MTRTLSSLLFMSALIVSVFSLGGQVYGQQTSGFVIESKISDTLIRVKTNAGESPRWELDQLKGGAIQWQVTTPQGFVTTAAVEIQSNSEKLITLASPATSLSVGTSITISGVDAAPRITASAETTGENQGGLVPQNCGQSFDNPSTPIDETSPCGFSDLSTLIHNVVEFIVQIIAPIFVVLMISAGGFTIMTSSGNAARYQKGREFIKWALIGYVIILASWMVLNAVLTGVGVAKPETFTNWFDLK
ncbi:MAG: hypothetical protein A2932_01680 [Candidatus Spechtbacteria bacterium RIFCSPLOWO2_01_FULL_46_10]|uniref:Uncharacterized protein n=1 Tax=Candidatus Spechtbacteria bacterium RIFCSPLOWO2_01_FULL_46_10 TaxID=1802163 RepID=A0A1G2HHU5_9BACT|nr:MAG: hypothetical protein A2932_01680 [Candidatus Spechtbacteria bacterium RIFCSPLOWO2_01_FULL_46_10]